MVERYAPDHMMTGSGMTARRDGGWVCYSDYARLQEQVETLTRKNERLGNTLKLHSGDVMSLNNEVELFRSHWNDAEARAEAAEAERDRLTRLAEFVARWAWRTDPPNANNKLTDGERLSAIKFHPTLKEFAAPHIELAAREAAALQKEPQP